MRLAYTEQIQGTTGHHGAKAKGCQRHCFKMCGVAQHAENTREGTADRAPTPASDIVALQIEQMVYVPGENYMNPLMEAKH